MKNVFLDALSKVLTSFIKENNNVKVAGDFNVDLFYLLISLILSRTCSSLTTWLQLFLKSFKSPLVGVPGQYIN